MCRVDGGRKSVSLRPEQHQRRQEGETAGAGRHGAPVALAIAAGGRPRGDHPVGHRTRAASPSRAPPIAAAVPAPLRRRTITSADRTSAVESGSVYMESPSSDLPGPVLRRLVGRSRSIRRASGHQAGGGERNLSRRGGESPERVGHDDRDRIAQQRERQADRTPCSDREGSPTRGRGAAGAPDQRPPDLRGPGETDPLDQRSGDDPARPRPSERAVRAGSSC